jgi:hypothetical protein
MNFKGLVKSLVLNVFGVALFKPPTDSTTAFQVQDADGNAILRVDTVNNTVVVGETAPTYTASAFAVRKNMTASGPVFAMAFQGNYTSSDSTAYALWFAPLVAPAAGSGAFGVYVGLTVGTGGGTTGIVYNFYIQGVAKSGGGTIPTQYGLYVGDLTAATNNCGIAAAVSSGADKFNLYIAGTADNYIAGKVGIGTTAPKSALHVVGLPTYADNAAAVAGGLTAGAFYRNNADPDLVCVVH